MRLEEATKEELIWWIRQHAFDLSYALKRFEADIMFKRNEELNAKAHLAGERYSEALSEYITLTKPYNGKPLSSIPDYVVKRIASLEKIMMSAMKEQQRLWKAADKCLKRIDKWEEE